MKKKITVVGVIVQLNNKFLMLFRTEKETDPSLWGIPAGKLEDGEERVDTAVRELFEETGLEITESDLSYMGLIPIDYEDLLVEFPIFHLVLEDEPDIKLNPREHINYEWFTPKEALFKKDLMKDVDLIIRQIIIDKIGL